MFYVQEILRKRICEYLVHNQFRIDQMIPRMFSLNLFFYFLLFPPSLQYSLLVNFIYNSSLNSLFAGAVKLGAILRTSRKMLQRASVAS